MAKADASAGARLAAHVKLSAPDSETLIQVYVFVEEFFRNPKFDASHDINHIKRVTGNALIIFDEEKKSTPLNPMTVLLGALLHDVEDKKYSDASIQAQSPVEAILLSCGLAEEYISKVQHLVEGVSYSSEVKNPAKVLQLIQEIPELGVVQDADRLDDIVIKAIGAIGIARCFTFGGAKSVRSMGDSVQHFQDKLLRLEGMMKTNTGKRMAAQRSQRIRHFMDWWQEEDGLQNIL